MATRALRRQMCVSGILGSAIFLSASMRPTGHGVADIAWSIFGGALVGSVACAGLLWGRAWLYGVLRLAVAVGCTAVIAHMSLPGPFALETIVGATVVMTMGIHALVRRRVSVPKIALLGMAGLACVIGAFVIVAALQLRRTIDEARTDAINGVEHLKVFEVEQGTADLRDASKSLDEFENSLNSVGGQLMRLLPVASYQREHVAKLVEPIQDLMNDSIEFAASRPDQGLTVQSGALNLSAVKQIESPLTNLTVATDRVLESASTASTPWLLPAVTSPLDSLTSQLSDFRSTLESTLRAVKVLPWILGDGGTRTYFLSIVSPVENRSGGGFPGAFGVLIAKDGKISVKEIGNIGFLINRGNPNGRVITGPADYLARYEQFGSGDGVRPAEVYFWSNITSSPDQPSIAEVTRQMYLQSGGTEIDGVITIDIHALSRILEVTGPVLVDGIDNEITATNVEEYLYRTQYFQLNSISNTTRRDRMFAVASAVVDRLTSMNLPGPSSLANILGPAVENGNIRLTFFNDAAQDLAHSMGADGEFGGPLSIADIALTNTNGAPNKIDAFLSRSVEHEVQIQEDGSAQSTTKIILKNDAPSSGYDEYVLGNVKGYPNGTNVTILSMYSPMYCSAEVDGRVSPVATEQELGWLVHSLGLGVPPTGQTTVVFSCEGNSNELGLGTNSPRVHSQAVVNDDEWKVSVSTPLGSFRYFGPLNSNKWRKIELNPAK